MAEPLEDLLRRLREDRELPEAGEEAICQGVVLPTLARLGWDRDNIREVVPQFRVKDGRVDYCLRAGDRRVFVEVKQASDTPLVIKILRMEGVKAAVNFAPVRIANGLITSKSVSAGPDKDEATIVLTVAKEAKPGLRQDVIISAAMRVGTQTITRFARAIPIQVVAGE